jgi:transcriptional regulator with XRE-family HTH domain
VDTITPQLAFVTRLRRYRQQRGISLDEIAAQTRVRSELFGAFEANELAAWPKGVYARAWIRAYASAVGLDPIDTVNEFCRLFPQGDRRVDATMAGIAEIVATQSAYRDDIPHTDRRKAGASAPKAAPPLDAISTSRPVRGRVRAATEAVAGATRLMFARVAGLGPSRGALR